MERQLYLVCYDVREARRLKRVCKLIQQFAFDGQKSAYVCRLSANEKSLLIERVCSMLLPVDAFSVIRLGVPAIRFLMGQAKPIPDDTFIYLG